MTTGEASGRVRTPEQIERDRARSRAWHARRRGWVQRTGVRPVVEGDRPDRALLDELARLRAELQAAQAEIDAIRERERERSPSNYHRRRTSAAAAYGSIPIRHATSLGTWAELGGAFLCLLTKRLAHD
jgi:hypothetical protein